MEWQDDALVLASRPQGESSALAILLTNAHGRHAGLVRGGRSGRQRSTLEPGTQVVARWRARLPDQLGTLTLEPVRSAGAALFNHPRQLATLVSACALVADGLQDRDPHPTLYQSLLALFTALEQPAWAEAYVRWEVGLLAELGFGLELSACTVTGATTDLRYVSPRTGRAVSQTAAGPWGNRLLALPGFLIGTGSGGDQEVAAGLALTGHFLENHLPRGLPGPRRRLAAMIG